MEVDTTALKIISEYKESCKLVEQGEDIYSLGMTLPVAILDKDIRERLDEYMQMIAITKLRIEIDKAILKNNYGIIFKDQNWVIELQRNLRLYFFEERKIGI